MSQIVSRSPHAASGLRSQKRNLPSLVSDGIPLSILQQELKALRNDLARQTSGGWLDAKGAAHYLSLSPNTFDKYRYGSSPRIEGCKVGGKMLYKKEDLDNFVRLYDLKRRGLA